MSTKNLCERCETTEATKLFFLFADAPPRISISTRICDTCYVDAGFAEASEANSETFSLVRINNIRAQWAEEAEAQQFVA